MTGNELATALQRERDAQVAAAVAADGCIVPQEADRG